MAQSTQSPLPTGPNLSPSWEDQSRSSTARSHWLDVSQAAIVLLKLMMVHSTLWSNIDDLSKIKKLGSWFLLDSSNSSWNAEMPEELAKNILASSCLIIFDDFGPASRACHSHQPRAAHYETKRHPTIQRTNENNAPLIRTSAFRFFCCHDECVLCVHQLQKNNGKGSHSKDIVLPSYPHLPEKYWAR